MASRIARLTRRSRRKATPELLGLVAARFRALAEPARLAILHALEDGERTVSELIGDTGIAQGNLSKHLQQLHASGLVARRKEGLFVYYALADADVLALCEIMCGRIEAELAASHAVVARRRGA